MNMMERVARDIQRITKTDFAVDLLFTPVIGDAVTVKGYHQKNWMDVSEAGFGGLNYLAANVRKSYCSVSEKLLVDAGFVTRDSNGDLINFAGTLVTVTDVSGQEVTYEIQKGQSRPDETVGHIGFILGAYTTPDTPTRLITSWRQASIMAVIVTTPDGSTQTLNNGDVIPLQYALNNDGYATWVADTSYGVGDAVNRFGSGWICRVANSDSSFDADKWTEVAPQYATLTIPYLTSVPGIAPLATFMIDGSIVQDEPYSAGTFDNSVNGGFVVDNNTVTFDATVPVWNF